jgi:hypothetical protein
VLTSWGVVLDQDGILDGDPSDPAHAWLSCAREAYVARCPRLVAFLREEAAVLRTTAEQLDPLEALAIAPGPSRVRIAASVVEVRRSSFDLAVRVRPVGDRAGEPADGRCTIVIELRASGERLAIPRGVRDEMVAIQLAARDLC